MAYCIGIEETIGDWLLNEVMKYSHSQVLPVYKLIALTQSQWHSNENNKEANANARERRGEYSGKHCVSLSFQFCNVQEMVCINELDEIDLDFTCL